MAGYVVLAVLAAYGTLCILWALLGWLLPVGRGGAAVCMCHPGLKEEFFVRRWCWLRGIGLVEGVLLVIDCGLDASERSWLESCRHVEFCSLEDLPARLELERNQIERTGTGNLTRRD